MPVSAASGGKLYFSDFLKYASELWLRREAHGSIRIQEGQPPVFDCARHPQVPDAQVAFGLRLSDGLEVIDKFADIDMRLRRRTRPGIEGTYVF